MTTPTTPKPKVMILWTRKGCRKAKMQGTATAVCSAATIEQFRSMARAGSGRLWIVEGASAADARRAIEDHKRGVNPVMHAVTDDGRTVALGTMAVVAIGGAREARFAWNERIRRQGRVTERQSKALTGDDEADMRRAFARGIGGVL